MVDWFAVVKVKQERKTLRYIKKEIKMPKDDINIYHFASDVDNKKLSNKQLAKKAKIISDERDKEADTKEKFKKIKEEREKKMSEYDYERKKPLIDEIAKRRTATEGSFKKGGMIKSGKPKIAKKGWR